MKKCRSSRARRELFNQNERLRIIEYGKSAGACAGDVQKAATPLVLLAKDTTTAAPSFSMGGTAIGFQSGSRNPNATPRVTVTLTDPQGKPEFVKQVYSTYTWICLALQRA
jgi:hypothetical protein